MSEGADEGHYADSDWVEKWHIGETGWHSDDPAQFLTKNGAEILGDKKKRIFVPLCGKAVDMIWMYEKGHEVVGVEIAEIPVKEFFEENKIDYDVNGKLYKSKDGRLSIFAENLFDISAEQYGKFDIIWDCKSFVAINLSDHQRYLQLMRDIMTPDCVYYLQTIEFDESLWPGPPHSIKDEVVKRLFGKARKIEILEDYDLKKPAAVNESKMLDNAKEQTNAKKTNTDKPKVVDPAMVALGKSSYIFLRWYKMVFK